VAQSMGSGCISWLLLSLGFLPIKWDSVRTYTKGSQDMCQSQVLCIEFRTVSSVQDKSVLIQSWHYDCPSLSGFDQELDD
jgi:hypothetical protein